MRSRWGGGGVEKNLATKKSMVFFPSSHSLPTYSPSEAEMPVRSAVAGSNRDLTPILGRISFRSVRWRSLKRGISTITSVRLAPLPLFGGGGHKITLKLRKLLNFAESNYAIFLGFLRFGEYFHSVKDVLGNLANVHGFEK
jgi:hypothetical protein